ncbi:efflux RND transporter permease subunit [Lewinella cohaerens]|uniref:efflux RND transporter permease subunit n=1 Tax=Lewinella cohaerens TaxID=70995 RepID=UPI0003668D83|nr:MMPL family transporter [Lewinella cohaerens]
MFKNSFQRSLLFVIRFRWLFAAFLLIATIAGALSTAVNLRINNAVSIWFLDDNPDYQAYLAFQQERGSDEIIIAMLPVEEALGDSAIQLLEQLHQRIDSLPDVTATFSLANARYPVYSNRKIYYRPIYQSGRTAEQMNQLLEELPAIKTQLVTTRGKHIFFYVQLNPTDQIEDQRNQIVTAIEELIIGISPNARISGQPILNEAFNDTIYNESNFFAVATVVVILLLLLFLLPHWLYVPIALVAIAVPISMLMGLMTGLGYSLNLISMLIPTILMVYSVGDAVHVINIFHQHAQDHPFQNRQQQIVEALQKSLKPCFFTTLTTVIGYLALYFSPLPAFKVMGIFTFVGMLLAFVLVYIVTAIGFYWLKEVKLEARVRKINIPRIVTRINFWTSQRAPLIFTLAAIVAVGGIAAVSKLEVNTDSLHLLGDGKAKTDLHAIEAKIGGNARFQINIRKRDGGTFLNSDELDKLATFQQKIADHPQLATPVSIINFKTFLENRRSPLAVFNPVNLPSLLEAPSATANPFFSLFSDDFSEVSVAVNVKELKTKQLEALLVEIDRNFAQSFDPVGYELQVHGFLALFGQLNQFILQTQFRSFGLAFLVAFGILVYFIGDLKTAALALIPNLLPLFLTIIVMTIFGVALEAANAMLAPIMLGVAMDDTIHLMSKYRERRAAGQTVTAALDQSLHYTGGALFSTTIALVCGFLVVGMSGVISVSTFGLLCAFTVLAALIADVIVLPALLKKTL